MNRLKWHCGVHKANRGEPGQGHAAYAEDAVHVDQQELAVM